METQGTHKGRYIAAAIIIGLGVLLLLGNLGFVHVGEVLSTWWPTAIIVFFLCRHFARQKRNSVWLWSIVVVMAIVQAGRLGWVAVDIFALWPLALVLIGISILSRHPKPRVMDEPARATIADNTVEAFALFTSVERIVQSSGFVGGEATSVFGSTYVDLAMATPTTGDMFMKVEAVFGEVVIRVPTEWNVSFNITPVFGSAEDIRSILHTTYQPSAPMLHITGSAVFGAVKLKN